MPKQRNATHLQPVSTQPGGELYERLFRINEGFATVALHLRLLRQHRWLHANQIRRFEEMTAEARAATNSYLLETFATQETKEAGRLFRKRLSREQKEDPG